MPSSSISSATEQTAAEIPIVASETLRQPRGPRYQSLDVWRGVACILVVIFHAGSHAIPDAPWALSSISYAIFGLSRRFGIGVPIFFVISGYCIAATADATRLRGKSTTDYFKRRLRRIYPPAWIWLGVSVFVVSLTTILVSPAVFHVGEWALPTIQSLTAWQLLGNFTLTESWRYLIVGDAKKYYLGTYWTLCYEEQFYLVFGLLLLVARRWLFQGIAAVSALSLATFMLKDTLDLRVNGTFLDGNWLMFAAGVAVYYWINYAQRAARRLITFALVLGAACAAREPRDLWWRPDDASFNQDFFVACSFALLLCALHPFDQRIASARIARPLAFAGRMCYSLYLVHWPLVLGIAEVLFWAGVHSYTANLLITFPCALCVSLTVAYLFHVTVERRFMNASNMPLK